jgi:hypothetical protein
MKEGAGKFRPPFQFDPNNSLRRPTATAAEDLTTVRSSIQDKLRKVSHLTPRAGYIVRIKARAAAGFRAHHALLPASTNKFEVGIGQFTNFGGVHFNLPLM